MLGPHASHKDGLKNAMPIMLARLSKVPKERCGCRHVDATLRPTPIVMFRRILPQLLLDGVRKTSEEVIHKHNGINIP